MRRSNKGTYLILALICLIILNIGSMTILFLRNIDIPVFNFKNIIREVFNITEGEDENKMNDDDMSEQEIDRAEDFIIINPIDNYENLIIVKDSKGKGSIGSIPESLNIEKIKIDKTKPYIFVYHTHATEGYIPFDDDTYYTENNDKNMIKIGDTLSKVLEASGHNVQHSTNQHDRPSYNQSYSRSLKTIQDAKIQEDNLKFFFDIHRDGIDKGAAYYESFLANSKTTIDGKEVATFSIVVGPDTPNYDKVLDFAKYIKIVADVMYPDLCTKIIVKPYGKFNLYISDYAALIEIGSNLNTLDQANETAKYVGEILDTVIRSIQE
ncbi:MAG: stage II sporulation protein P [Tissierellaceae bacterium]|nr:stage II sporulation protein P [Tissierellaceae bacterium]